jgi:hypothetical protein
MISLTGSLEQHPVARLQLKIGQLAAQRIVAADDVDGAAFGALEDRHLADLLADQRRAVRNHDLGEKVRPLAALKQRLEAFPIRQDALANQRHVGNPHNADGDPEAGDLEHAERRQPLGAGDAIDQEVGGCADQGAGAAQDRGIRDRNQELRGRGCRAAGPARSPPGSSPGRPACC